MSKEMIDLAEELREYTAMKYAGDCKCGKCQLVPRKLVERIYHTLNSAVLRASAVAEPDTTSADEMRKTAAELRAGSNGDCGAISQALMWDRKAEDWDRANLAHPAPAAPVSASVREALEKIANLRPSLVASQLVDMFIECRMLAKAALASLPAPEAAPTREEPTAEAIREILLAHIFATRHYEIRGLDEAANAIIALKAAPAK